MKYEGSQENFRCICPTMLTDSGKRQEVKVFTRWKGDYTSRVIAANRLINEIPFNQDACESSGFLYTLSKKQIFNHNIQMNIIIA